MWIRPAYKTDIQDFVPSRDDLAFFDLAQIDWQDNWHYIQDHGLEIFTALSDDGVPRFFFGVSPWNDEMQGYPLWLLKDDSVVKDKKTFMRIVRQMVDYLKSKYNPLCNVHPEGYEDKMGFVRMIGGEWLKDQPSGQRIFEVSTTTRKAQRKSFS